MRRGRTMFLLAAAVVVTVGAVRLLPVLDGHFHPHPRTAVGDGADGREILLRQGFQNADTAAHPSPGFPPPTCEDQPDDARILRAMEHVTRGVPYFYEEFRDNIEIVKERIKDTIDPPRFFPLIGPAQLHHCHWKCTISYDETIESGYPFPFRCRRPRVKVVYIDLDHLHLYPGCTPESQQAVSRDLSGP